ncbi:tRNA (adenosine(37)-N6)-methyltransferase TrmM [Oceanisphaera profunda]|uniref:tRNA1(Val) (adenine(37)-N6)-methyltransferase n=1 Tax=Oceanisphaera profunda TaxID=1416627 RepID=A0A1Y0D4K8_9GAMM|nr:methyltransferase [Oceanisphaera profunda]ART82045.1 tRNA (adenosine(37)-N6)-methyltransferase TrmM [Oceanisphaera profunda]
MSSRGFTFKQFHINHDRCGMKVGTDGILLGAWAHLGSARRILDLGTGSGLVALMLAQRALAQRTADEAKGQSAVEKTAEIEIIGLELDDAAASQAADNVAASPWPTKIIIEQGAVQDYQAPSFDLIVSNPPYFVAGQSFVSQARANARHTGSLSLADLFAHARRLSAPHGQLALVLPHQALAVALTEAELQGWHLAQQVAVCTKVGKPALRFLLLFSSVKCGFTAGELVINAAEGGLDPAYVDLVRSFYLKM